MKPCRVNRKNQLAVEPLCLELRVLPAASSLLLSDLDGTNGATFYGAAGNEGAGDGLSGVGDVNGDGFDDFIIRTYGATNKAYLVFGKSDWSRTPTTVLSTLNGTTGVQILGVSDSGAITSVSAAGDVNHDGFDDFVIGNTSGNGPGDSVNNLGEAYLVFGKADWSGSSTFNLSSLNGSNGVIFYGVDAFDGCGSSVGPAGDVNGDTFDDFLIGAPFASGSANNQSQTGEVYVVFGKSDWSGTPSVNLSSLNGTSGVTLYGVDASDRAGEFLGKAGDVNADGFDDILISAQAAAGSGNSQANTGEVYVVFGKSDWSSTSTVLLGSLNGSNGVVIYGEDGSSAGGGAFHTAGDFNGDGFDDIAFGAKFGRGPNGSAEFTGQSYVIFGKSSWSSTFLVSAINGTNGVTFYGKASSGSGYTVDFVGDANGDGYSDVLIGAPFQPFPQSVGEAYLVYGKGNWGFVPQVNLSSLNGNNGYTLLGIDVDDHTGTFVSGAGDVNNDGFNDFLVNAHVADGNGNLNLESGDIYLVFGFDTSNPVIDKVGVRRGDTFYQDANNSFSSNIGDAIFHFGNSSDVPLVGDWNNDGFDEIGIWRNGLWYLDLNGNNAWDGIGGGDTVFSFGNPSDTPIVGDWNGDGTDDVGVKRGKDYYLDANGSRIWNGTGGGDAVYHFGNPTDTPVVGDWDGNGHDKIGVYRNGTFYLDQNGNGVWNDIGGGDSRFGYGMAGDRPVVGDWNGDGVDDVGIMRGNAWYLDQNGNRAWNGTIGGDALFVYGNSTDTPIIGRWKAPAPGPVPSSLPLSSATSEGSAVGSGSSEQQMLDTLFSQLAVPVKKVLG
ncbi:MAG: FG-GAP repeat protein [Planctomycetaceae bacterium]|nr:FG-GAP repeat protein [Planctomycetaceae bacterium]